MDAPIITSKQNPKIKTLVGLRRRRDREQAGITLVEGYEELDLALRSGVEPQGLYFCSELMSDMKQLKLKEKIAELGAECTQVSRDVFEKIAYRESPDGWLAVVPALKSDLQSLIFRNKSPFLLVCEAVEKPGNMGAMLRTCDAAGVDAMIAADPITDWGNPNIIRASKGAVFSTPIASASNEELLAWLRTHKIQVVASTPDTDTYYTDVDLTQPLAFFVGTEKYGLSDFWFENADSKVRIPMVGQVDSLNVATSAAILLYEAARQRGIR